MYGTIRASTWLLAAVGFSMLTACATKQNSPGCTKWGDEPRAFYVSGPGRAQTDTTRYLEYPCIEWGGRTGAQQYQEREEAKVQAQARQVAYAEKYPLHSAVERKDANGVKRYLAAGASLQQKDEGGRYPIEALNAYDNADRVLEVLKVLKAHGQDLGQGQDIMRMSIYQRHVELVKYLGFNGVNVNETWMSGREPKPTSFLDYALGSCAEIHLGLRATRDRERYRPFSNDPKVQEEYYSKHKAACDLVISTLKELGAKTASQLTAK